MQTRSTRRVRLPQWLGAGLCLATYLACAPAGAAVVVSIVGDVATAQISLPTAGPTYTATLTLSFDQPTNLSESCLGISAQALDAAAQAAVDARIVDAPATALDPAFPVLVVVSPPIACGLSFRNQVQVSLQTPDLSYSALSPYRLYKAPDGGSFADITSAVESGSVRARGGSGSFSEFIIAKRSLQDYAADASETYLHLLEEIARDDISPTTQNVLEADLQLSRAAFLAGDYVGATGYVQQFRARTQSLAGTEIPNLWSDDRTLVDTQGELLSLADTLLFALDRLQAPP